MNRRRRNNNILKLKDEKGVWKHKGSDLRELKLKYFQDLFGSNQGDMNAVLNCVERNVTDAQNEVLLEKVNAEEVRKTIFSMYPEKSLGANGLNPKFLLELLGYYWG